MVASIAVFMQRLCPTDSLSNHEWTPALSSLIDGGANGGMAGNDVTVLSESSFNNVNVTGISESLIQKLPLVSAAGLVNTQHSPSADML